MLPSNNKNRLIRDWTGRIRPPSHSLIDCMAIPIIMSEIDPPNQKSVVAAIKFNE